MSDRPEDPFDGSLAAENPAEEARGLRGLLGRHAVDTRPLRIPEYRRILIGQGTSFVGSMLTQVAVPVQIWALTASPLYVGFVGLAGLVPIVVFGLYGGAIADAVDRRVLYLWSSIGGWVVTLALLVQTLLDLQNIWLILALVFVQSGMFAVASSARGAIIPRIVPTELVPAANTLNFTVGNVGQVVGPLIAGLLLVLPNGFALAYAADALLFTAALYSVLKPALHPAAGGGPAAGLAGGRGRTAVHRGAPRARHELRRRHRRHGSRHATVALPGRRGRPVRRAGRAALRRDRHRRGRRRAVQRLDRPGPPPGSRAHPGDRRVGRRRRGVRAGRAAVAGRRPARPGRRVRPGQRGLPADHPPDLRPRRDARSDAGRLHRRGRGRPPPRRRAGRRDRRGDLADVLVGRPAGSPAWPSSSSRASWSARSGATTPRATCPPRRTKSPHEVLRSAPILRGDPD